MSMDTVRATLREEIDDQVAEHGSWDHGRAVAATLARLHPFTHLDLADVVGYAVRNLAQAMGRRKEHAGRRAYQRVVRDGERVNKPLGQMRLFELRKVINDYQANVRRDSQVLAWYEAVQDAFIADVGERPITTTTIGEVVDLDAVAAAERRAA